MSGAGRKVFQPGEVLTASNVQNYLMDQAVQYYAGTAARGSAIGTATTEGMMSYLADSNSVQMATGTATWVNVDGVPIVAGTAARDALYPSPVPGNIVFRSDSLQRETYYAAAGTPTRAAGWYSGQDGGLVPIIPTSVTINAGSATVTNNGTISLSGGPATITINGVFSSTYTNYLIQVMTTANSTDYGFAFKYSAAGTATTANTYYWNMWENQLGTTSLSVSSGNPQTSHPAIRMSGINGGHGEIQVYSPYVSSAIKRTFGKSMDDNYFRQSAAKFTTTGTAYDGFQLATGGATITSGTIQVYGIRN